MNQKSNSLKTSIAAASLVGLGALWVGSRIRRQAQKLNLHGKTVLITGSSRGLGLALAREFAREGARVALVARDAEELKVAEEDVRRCGGGLRNSVRGFVCDLRKPEDIVQLVSQVERELARVDILVNNAGTIIVGPYQDMSANDFREAMDVNFWAALHTTMAVAPGMMSRGEGRIVNITSIGGKMPVPHLLPYCASKFALVGFSSGLRSELMRSGVLVSTIIPGLMRTGSPRNANFKGNHQGEYAWFAIGDAIPGLSMSAVRAARRIVQAAIYGEAEVTLGLPAKLGSLLYGIAPTYHEELSAWVNRLLPKETGRSETRRGSESESAATRSPLLHFNRKAEQQFNQL